MRIPVPLVGPSGMTACASYRQRLVEAAGDDGLDLDDRTRAHVERCQACQDELIELLRTSRMLHRLGELTRRVEPPPGDWAALRLRLVAERSSRAGRRRHTGRPVNGTLALAMAPALVALLLAPQAGLVAGGMPEPTALVEPGTLASAVDATAAPTPTAHERGSGPEVPASHPPAGRVPDEHLPVGAAPGDVVRPADLATEPDVIDTPPGQDITPAESAAAPGLPAGGGPVDRPVTADPSPDPRGAMSPQQTLGPPDGPRLSRTIE